MSRVSSKKKEPCEVFINHRGKDTKENFASLLEARLASLGISAFLDKKSLKPGQNLVEEIEKGIDDCKVALAVCSPRYCNSWSCLTELAFMVEREKKIVTIFWDVRPAKLKLGLWGYLFWKKEDRRRFKAALKVARNIVGIRFNSKKGSRVTRPNLPPDPSVLVKSPEGCRNCSSDAPSVLPLRSGRTALDGSSLVLVGDAGRSRGSGGHLGHAPASCLRGVEAVDLTGNGAGRSRSSGGHLASAPASCLRGADAVDLNGNAARSWGSGGQHALHSHEMVHCSSCLRGSPVDDVEEHNGNAAKNTDGGEQHAQNNHVHAHCSSCLRGAPVTETVVLNGNAATNLGSGGQFSGKSLDLCRLANPPDSDPRTAEVHAARGSSPSDNVCASSKGYARQQGHEGTFGASQQRHLSGVGSSVAKENLKETEEDVAPNTSGVKANMGLIYPMHMSFPVED
ncbi:hypothetical protein Ancab_033793 [Ancistrocladus abbreviatus]